MCFFLAEGCSMEFRLASCGQDSQLKIWIVSQREGAGRPTLFFTFHQDPHCLGEKHRADCVHLEIFQQNKGILLVCRINRLRTHSLIMDHFKTFLWNTAACVLCEVELAWTQVHISSVTFITCTSSLGAVAWGVCSYAADCLINSPSRSRVVSCLDALLW